MTGNVRPATGQGDPWNAFGYIVSGVAVYGALGWLADRWLNTGFLVAAGIIVGAGFGIYMTFARFGSADSSADSSSADHSSEEKK